MELTWTLITLIIAAVVVGIAFIAFWTILAITLCSRGSPAPDEQLLDPESGLGVPSYTNPEQPYTIQVDHGHHEEPDQFESHEVYDAHQPTIETEPLKEALEAQEQETQDGMPVVAYDYTPEQEEYMRNNTGRYLVQALHPFTPEDEGQYQLTFKADDLIWVVDSHPEEDWWIGEMCDSGEKGYFPTNYVQVLKRTIKSSTRQSSKIAEIAKKINL